MRCLSKVFQPIISIPPNAKIKNTEITCTSQRLLLECGLVRPTGAGLFALLPLARRALAKLEGIITDALEEAGAQRMSLPALADARLWERSGRLESAQTELMQLRDRHGKNYLLAPTHEEGIADLLADVGPLSYKQLPLVVYQLTNKYRDELRPKHGLLRAREFRMADVYAAHTAPDCAERVYRALAEAYARIFRTIGLHVYRVSADGQSMGGSESHEWQLPAAAGEDAVHICASCSHASLAAPGESETACQRCGQPTSTHNSIEVGHTFMLGTTYSAPLRAEYIPASGSARALHMSCYGIGTTRLLAAALEARSTETALRWPDNIAPYHTLIIPPKEGSREDGASSGERVRAVYAAVTSHARDALVDDRTKLTVGKRLLLADRMGYPHVVVMGRDSAASPPRYELHTPHPESNPRLLTLDELRELHADTQHRNIARE